MNNRLNYLICISNDIVTGLKLEDYTQQVEGKNYLQFTADVEDINIENNYLSNDKDIEAAFNRVLLAPKPLLKKFVIKFRESRYEFKLALDELSKRSQRSYINNTTDQLITLLDYVTPEYSDFINRGNNQAYTKRLGYIPITSVTSQGNIKNLPYEDSYKEFGNLITLGKIGITFYETTIRY